jgi:hypothetical protein
VLVAHKIVVPTDGRDIDFEATVEQTILDWKRRYSIVCVRFDPYSMIPSAQRLLREGVPMEEFPQTVSNLTESSQNLHDIISGRNFSCYPDEQIRTAVSHAVAIESPRGWRIGKTKTQHKIDFVVALGMAALAATKHDISTAGYPLSIYMAANDMAPPAPDDIDGSREWRDARAPKEIDMQTWIKLTGAQRPTSGPEAETSTPLGQTGYKARQWYSPP